MRSGSERAEGLIVVMLTKLLPPCGRRPIASPGGQVKKPGPILFADVGSGTRPKVPPRHSDHSGANRVPFHIADGCPFVMLVERAGEESVLPEVAAAAVQTVDVLRVVA